jgi:CDGSH-type Zn-finger protein
VVWGVQTGAVLPYDGGNFLTDRVHERQESLMEKAKVAGTQPIAVELTQGKEYWWCACGRSASQPFCDGSHKGTGLEPLGFKAAKSGENWLCMCKQTKTPPYCDGSHNKL